MNVPLVGVCLFLLWHSVDASAACPHDVDVALMAARYANLQPAPSPPNDLTMADATCARDKFIRFLSQQGLGKVVGYKAGLTSAAAQKRFNYPEPIRGTLFEKMILRDGAEVSARYGARPFYEADMVVEVADSAIMKATTVVEVLAHVSRIYPFIELVDQIVEPPASPEAARNATQSGGIRATYVNAGARLGVLGKPFTMPPTAESAAALAAMKIKLLDHDGKEIDANTGNAILGQPLNAVLWLIGDLKKNGVILKRGDLLSLGSLSTKVLVPKSGTSATLIYEGVRDNPSVTVRFR